MNESSNPFELRDTVRFTPAASDLGKLSAMELYGIVPGEIGQVVRIEENRYIYLEKSKPGMGLDWEMFTLVKKWDQP